MNQVMPAPDLQAADRDLLDAVQRDIPLTARPFDEVGARCGLSGREVRERLGRLKEAGIVRQISAIFDTRSLGYASSLVAARVDPADLEHAAAVISAHPGVSHNYLRNHDFNLWYTIAISPRSRLGLAASVERLHAESRALSTRLLPTVKLFKIGVRFDLGRGAAPRERGQVDRGHARRNDAAETPLTGREIAFVRSMQRDLPLAENPFAGIAEELGMTLSELREMHQRFLADGRMRRFAGVLHHRKAGFSANAMGVWAGPAGDDEELDRLGKTMAGFHEVSHCYQRPSYPDWPYNLFTMVHGPSREHCDQVLASIAAATGLTNRMALYSSREFKKERVRYFTGEEAAWEERLLGPAAVWRPGEEDGS